MLKFLVVESPFSVGEIHEPGNAKKVATAQKLATYEPRALSGMLPI